MLMMRNCDMSCSKAKWKERKEEAESPRRSTLMDVVTLNRNLRFYQVKVHLSSKPVLLVVPDGPLGRLMASLQRGIWAQAEGRWPRG